MGVTRKAWITYRDTHKLQLHEPIAIVASPGLRSVGKIAIDTLVENLEPRLVAEVFSYGFPGVYYGPSFLGAPSHVGVHLAEDNLVYLPSVRIYAHERDQHARGPDLVLVSGYQAVDPPNHYMVAAKVAELLAELRITRLFALGAQVIEEGIRCCATDAALLTEMARFGIARTQVDRFIGFSGLVAALAGEQGIKGVCLFASTSQNASDPEYPDWSAAELLVAKVCEIVGVQGDASHFEEESSEPEQREAIFTALHERESEEERARARAQKRERKREEQIGYG
jgi:proteasome assembly chaperone (PAC2) family protein